MGRWLYIRFLFHAPALTTVEQSPSKCNYWIPSILQSCMTLLRANASATVGITRLSIRLQTVVIMPPAEFRTIPSSPITLLFSSRTPSQLTFVVDSVVGRNQCFGIEFGCGDRPCGLPLISICAHLNASCFIDCCRIWVGPSKTFSKLHLLRLNQIFLRMIADSASSCDCKEVIIRDHNAPKSWKWEGHFLRADALSPQTSAAPGHSRRAWTTVSDSWLHIRHRSEAMIFRSNRLRLVGSISWLAHHMNCRVVPETCNDHMDFHL